ncbi:MAG: glycosyltransferase family 2 protein [Acidobacteria bacterium]|nr:glycosyltransferase family 2 protein [Acidobacteriota bacterium]
MRVGKNPASTFDTLASHRRHRILVPVYIPHTNEYFADALEILQLCLRSLRATINKQAGNEQVAVTLIANGCCDEALQVLETEFAAGWLDQLCVNQTNRGKVDAIISVARGSFEPLLTFADADVLFHPGWLQKVEAVFAHFPDCGFVSPMPNPTKHWYNSSATLWAAKLRGELRRAKVVSDAALDAFAQSIGNPAYFPAEVRQSQWIVERNGQQAVVGAGHFVCTLRREVLAAMPKHAALKGYDSNADQRWLDQPPDALGFWRLATTEALVAHLGNVAEPWMHERLADIEAHSTNNMASHNVPPPPAWHVGKIIPYGVRRLGIRAVRKMQRLFSR